MIFFVGDTHFGHTNILEYEFEYRPYGNIEKHDQAIIDNWNSVVLPSDIVYHLGDVAFGRVNVEKVERLNGIKHLILGNHDARLSKKLLKEHFVSVQSTLRVTLDGRDVWMCHYATPIQEHLQPPNGIDIYIHGHSHSRSPKVTWQDSYPRVNVSLEQTDMRPISWDDIIKRIRSYTVMDELNERRVIENHV